MLDSDSTDDFDADGSAGRSQFVLQGHFVLTGVRVKAAVHLQVTGGVLLPVGTGSEVRG